MDDPCIDRAAHEHALSGLARLNRWSRSARIIWSPLGEYARRNRRRCLRILDIATGAGDIPIWLQAHAKQAGIELSITACDVNQIALDHARRKAERFGVEIAFLRLNALEDELPSRFDLVMTSLFLHHLNAEQAVLLMQKMADASDGLVVINDLRRCRRGLALAFCASRLLTTSRVVHLDAVQSVRAAFSLAEVKEIADRAGLGSATMRRRWPCRFCLVWSRSC